MLRHSLSIIAVALAVLLAPEASAQQSVWRLMTRDGVVRVRVADASHDARLNEILQPGAVVTTGADSSAMIGNGLQRMTMSSNSRLTISSGNGSGMTRIIQSLGSILFQVDHRETPHFLVQTPRLAAIVKGTTFSVIVRDRWDVVAVSSGLVEVRSNRGHSSVDVATGQAARVSTAAPDRVVLFADPALALSESPASGGDAPQLRAGGVAASTESQQLTFGASQAAPAPPPAWQARVGSRMHDQEWIVRGILAYLAISFALGFFAFFGFRYLERASKRRAERRGGS